MKQLAESGNTTLVWRARGENAATAQQSGFQAQPASHHAPAQPAKNFPVTLASQLEPVHPLNDPFNDRRAQPVVQLGQPRGIDDLQPGDGGDFQPGPLPEQPMLDDPLRQPMDGNMQPMPAPLDGVQPMVPRQELPCDDVYNDRNCCVENGECAEFKGFEPLNKVNKDLLNITSVPEQLSAAKTQWGAVRTWKSCDGRDLIQGRLANYRFGKVEIQEDGGRVREFNLNDLSPTDICFVTAWTKLPPECTVAGHCEHRPLDDGRYWIASTFTWKASALCHKPLYFEDIQLERYGHSWNPVAQPFVDGAHFFTNVAFLPYNIGINPMTECRYALGYYRPGSCAPWLIDPVPLSVRGAAYQTVFWTGVGFAIP